MCATTVKSVSRLVIAVQERVQRCGRNRAIQRGTRRVGTFENFAFRARPTRVRKPPVGSSSPPVGSEIPERMRLAPYRAVRDKLSKTRRFKERREDRLAVPVEEGEMAFLR